MGEKSSLCSICHKKFQDIPLLYPIVQKDYFDSNSYTVESWKNAIYWFAKAFTLTIFGYGAPISDKTAKKLLQSAWLKDSPRQLEHIELIDIESEGNLYKRWEKFIPSHPCQFISCFEKSRLWYWPRRSCEWLFHPMSTGMPSEKFSMPVT
jgi:hypothetical protein